MTALHETRQGFLNSALDAANPWERLTSNLRRRLIARGWPFRALFSVKPISDLYDFCAFVQAHRRIPNFRKTHYFNDYLFHIKTTGENLALRSKTSDKEQTKNYLAGLLGANYSVPTLDVIADAQALADYQFPLRSIVKPTHMSGVVFRCGTQQPTRAERAVMQSWFDVDYAVLTGEWNYRGLRPKIIIEPFLTLNGGVSHDVRFFVYQGKVRVIEVYCGRYRNPTMDFFDAGWNAIPNIRASRYGRSRTPISRPEKLPAMLEIAERIGRELSFVRVDFFTDFQDQFYIGELTHINGNARVHFEPVSSERLFLGHSP
jgi:hypothetical protein